MLSSGNTEGVFQLESPGMTSFFMQLKPKGLEDVIAGIALFRPGPMDSIPKYLEGKNNPASITYLHPKLEPILDVTYGCIVYQEQVMQIVRDLAGFDFARSDLMRRAMGKKKPEVMLEQKKNFIYGKHAEGKMAAVPGCINNGIPKETAEKIFEAMEAFASYAFNKSHAAAYAVIAYQTAYLKCHYPKEFMAALMTSAMGEAAKLAKYIKNAEKMGIKVLPPSILESEWQFTVTDDGNIRFGLGALNGVGRPAATELIEKRGPFLEIFLTGGESKFQDFFEVLDISKAGKTAMEAFIKTGATEFGFIGHRAQHLAMLPALSEKARSDTKNRGSAGQVSMFDMNTQFKEIANKVIPLPDINEFSNEAKLEMEQELAGVFFTRHPLEEYEEVIASLKEMTDTKWDSRTKTYQRVHFVSAGDFETADEEGGEEKEGEIVDGDEVRTVIRLTGSRKLLTKKGKEMAFASGQDLSGDFEFVLFPGGEYTDREGKVVKREGAYDKFADLLINGEILVVQGRMDLKNEQPKILVQKMTKIDEGKEFLEKKKG
jgi:DNA polymerase-3 subunit alpha